MPKPQDDEFGPVDITNLGPDMIPQSVCRWRWLGEFWESEDPKCPMKSWYFDDGGQPSDHGMQFCPGCGKPLEVMEPSEEESK